MPIVCPGCNHILEEGIGPTKHKLCIHCIQRRTPAADIKKVKKLYDENEQDVDELISSVEGENLKKKTELIFSLTKMNGVVMAHFKINIPSTGQSFEVAFDKDQLQSFINEIELFEEKDVE